MSKASESILTGTNDQVTQSGTVVELSDEALSNLTGFFDVLIQMDLALKQCNKQRDENDDC